VTRIMSRAALRTCLICLLTFGAAADARAGDEPALTVSGPALDRSVTLTRSALQDLPRTEYVTTTIWTKGPQHFVGVTLRSLLDHLDIEAETLEFTAVNDYSITVPVIDIGQDNPMIAYARNDGPMSLREKGPFWLVYNYDSDPVFRTETVYSRSIWQLDRITAR